MRRIAAHATIGLSLQARQDTTLELAEKPLAQKHEVSGHDFSRAVRSAK
jgi:hypothetical protein